MSASTGLPLEPRSPPSAPVDARAAQFRLYWAGQGISSLGDAFAFVAMPLLVLDVTGSVASMGLVSATGVGAMVVAGLFSGAIVDRSNRRRLMIACDVGRSLAYGLVPVCWALGLRSLALIFVTTAVGGLLGNLFQVAYVAALPELVGRERLQRANSQMAATQALAYVLGPLCAGAVAAHTGPATALAIDALTFVFSAASIVAIDFGALPAGGAHSDRSASAGLRYLFRHPLMRPMTILIIALGLTSNVGLSAGIVDLIIFHLKRDLVAGDRAVGLVLGVASIGAVLAAALAPRLRRRLGFGACFLGGTMLQAVGLLAIGLLHAAAVVAAGALLWAGGLMLRSVASQALRQEITPPEMLGRAAAAYVTLAFATSALGTTLVTRAGAHWGATAALTAIGVSVLLVVLAGALTPVRRRYEGLPEESQV
ncbi:MAG TPA: MFS transporter [Polyangia bacterium]|nr:MFS transporter [Polyangia bacterium]